MKFKKLGSLLMAGCLAMSLAVPAFAEEPAKTADITITAPSGTANPEGSTDAKLSTFDAYRILILTTSLNANDHTADGHTCNADCYNYAYTVNGKYLDVLQSMDIPETYPKGDTTITTDANDNDVLDGEEIIAYISSMDDKGTEIRKFADDLYAAIKAASPALSADATSEKSGDNALFNNAAQGYYLIVEQQLGAETTDDVRSLVMLDTKGQSDITVETKGNIPVMEKKVYEETGTAWQDSADYDIGDLVPFQLTASLPNNIADYKNAYQFIFHDTLSENLTLDKSTVEVYIMGTKLTTGYTVSDVTDNEFTVTIADVITAANKKNSASDLAGQPVQVKYKATLGGTNTVIGNPGQDNVAYLQFSNDPYGTGTSKTVQDVVTVFTYQVVVDKVTKSGAALPGAAFKLQKDEGSGYKDIDASNGGASATLSNDGTTFTFTGLDRGKYKLVETTVPAGYNKADDILFEIVPTMDTESADPKLTVLEIKNGDKVLSDETNDATFAASAATGIISTKVVNSTGLRLPSTGGMGTFLFYGAGALLVAAGGTLMGKKRKEDAEA